jgi:predicted PurR-regulated permease PerM
MGVLKTIFMVIAIISVPLLTIFLIRFTLKLSRGFTSINRTLDDARPQINMLLVNINHTMEDINQELERIGRMTDEAQDMLDRSEKSLSSLESALSSPLAKFGGVMAGFLTTSFLVRGVLRRSERRARKVKRMVRHR